MVMAPFTWGAGGDPKPAKLVAVPARRLPPAPWCTHLSRLSGLLSGLQLQSLLRSLLQL